MKVLFVIPPYQTTAPLYKPLFPMPLAAVRLGTILKRAGHQVTIKDFVRSGKISACTRPASFEGKHAPPYRHYGTPMPAVLRWLDKYVGRYDVVCLCSCQCNIFGTVYPIANRIRVLGTPLVIGGPFATTAPDEVILNAKPNVLVRGEGEGVILEAMWLAANHCSPTKVLIGPRQNLDDLPLPDWTLAPPSKYPKCDGRVRCVLAVTRGCPWACTFCSVHTIMGRRWDRMSLPKVRDYLMMLFKQGVRYFTFIDDNLFFKTSYANELLDLIEKLRRKVKGFSSCRFYIEEGIEIRTAAVPGLLKRAKALGFVRVTLGLETMNAQRLKDIQKPFDVKALKQAIRQCHRAGVTPRAFYIIGFPGDTLASVCRDLVSFSRTGFLVRENNLHLLPGTKMHQLFEDRGWVAEGYDWRMTFFTPTSTGLTYVEIKHLKTILRTIAYALDQWGVCLGVDSDAVVGSKLTESKCSLRVGRDGEYRIRGKLSWRPAAASHVCEWLVLRAGHAGAEYGSTKTEVWARPLPKPKNLTQHALAMALQGKRMKERVRPRFF